MALSAPGWYLFLMLIDKWITYLADLVFEAAFNQSQTDCSDFLGSVSIKGMVPTRITEILYAAQLVVVPSKTGQVDIWIIYQINIHK